MKRFVLVLLLVLPMVPGALGQPADAPSGANYTTGEDRPARITLEGLYQHFSDEGDGLTEVSLPLGLYLPFGNSVALSLTTNYAVLSGSDLETTSGFGDVQIVTSYFQPAGAGSLVLSLGVNATTGTSALSFEEFRTATLASQTVYDLRVPTFGQGIRVAPAVTYAFPAGERLALGLGASYQYRGPYQPLDDLADTYDPGEEVLLTAGADVQLGVASSASLDLSLGLNGTDTWGATNYEPGNTFAATAQLRTAVGVHEVRAVARYRSRGEGDVPEAAVSAGRAVPTQLLLLGDARFQISPMFEVGSLARVRRYGESALFAESQLLVDLGLVPSVAVTEQVRVVGRFLYTLGSFSGITAGGGLSIAF